MSEQVDPDRQAAPVAQVDLAIKEPQVVPDGPVGLEAEHQVVPDELVGLVVEQDQVLAGNRFDLKQNHRMVLADMKR